MEGAPATSPPPPNDFGADFLFASSSAPTYWLTRFVILRWLGFVYLVAFLVAVNQIVPLVGEHGVTPAPLFMERAYK